MRLRAIDQDPLLVPQQRRRLRSMERALLLAAEVRAVGSVEFGNRRIRVLSSDVTASGALRITELEAETLDGGPVIVDLPVLIVNPPLYLTGTMLDVDEVDAPGAMIDVTSSARALLGAILGASWAP